MGWERERERDGTGERATEREVGWDKTVRMGQRDIGQWMGEREGEVKEATVILRLLRTH